MEATFAGGGGDGTPPYSLPIYPSTSDDDKSPLLPIQPNPSAYWQSVMEYDTFPTTTQGQSFSLSGRPLHVVAQGRATVSTPPTMQSTKCSDYGDDSSSVCSSSSPAPPRLPLLSRCYFCCDYKSRYYSISEENERRRRSKPQCFWCTTVRDKRFVLLSLIFFVTGAALALVLNNRRHHDAPAVDQTPPWDDESKASPAQQEEWIWDHNVYYATASPPQPQSENPPSTLTSDPATTSLSGALLLDDPKGLPQCDVGDCANKNQTTRTTVVLLEPDGTTTTHQQNNHNNKRRNMLLLQVVDGANDLSQELASIASRPNRAYARQWTMDFVQFNGGGQRRCNGDPTVDFAIALHELFAQQEKQERQQESSSAATQRHHWALLQHHRDDGNLTLATAAEAAPATEVPSPPPPPRPVFDAVALFPPALVITNLDSDLLRLLPRGKLAAFPLQQQDLPVPVLLLSLRHELSKAVINAWYSHIVVRSGGGGGGGCASNPLRVLREMIVQEANKANTTVRELVYTLSESSSGRVGDATAASTDQYVLKGSTSPNSNRGELERLVRELQTTADSICYRYYPKCEVL